MSEAQRYRLIRSIGSGGMAQVYEAVLVGAQGFERRVALKRVLPQHAQDPAMRRMFLHEARVASRLHHSNIVQVIDYGIVDETEFIVMEFVDGVDGWRARTASGARHASIGEGLALYIAAETAHALHYAHGLVDEAGQPLGIVHRDVSPHNILLSWQGDVKLSDFGIALGGGREERTQTGVVKGKRAYMAPEQALGRRVTGAADIYALGATLQALLVPPQVDDADGATRTPAGALGAFLAECRASDPAARPSAAQFAERAAELAGARLGRDGRSALRHWLAGLRESLSRHSSLDDVFDLALVPVGSRRFTVSRRVQESSAAEPTAETRKLAAAPAASDSSGTSQEDAAGAAFPPSERATAAKGSAPDDPSGPASAPSLPERPGALAGAGRGRWLVPLSMAAFFIGGLLVFVLGPGAPGAGGAGAVPSDGDGGGSKTATNESQHPQGKASRVVDLPQAGLARDAGAGREAWVRADVGGPAEARGRVASRGTRRARRAHLHGPRGRSGRQRVAASPGSSSPGSSSPGSSSFGSSSFGASRPERARSKGLRAWLRVGGRALAGKRVEIDGQPAGYAPLELDLPSGPHALSVRDLASGRVIYRSQLMLRVSHTREAPLRVIR